MTHVTRYSNPRGRTIPAMARHLCLFLQLQLAVIAAASMAHEQDECTASASACAAKGAAYLQHSSSSHHVKLTDHADPVDEDGGDHGWTYAESDKWDKVYPDCRGAAQSPIDIDTSIVDKDDGSGELSLIKRMNYSALSGRNIRNNGHNVQVDGGFGTLTLPDGTYEVLQFHFHFPSEHAVNGMLTTGEMHIVHKNPVNGRLAVVGILLQDEDYLARDIGTQARATELAFLMKLGFGVALPVDQVSNPVKTAIDLNSMLRELSGPYFHYTGSLTTPPCSEGVHWYVLQRIAAVKLSMVKSFTDAMATSRTTVNNRPVQQLNGRKTDVDLTVPGEYDGATTSEADKDYVNDANAGGVPIIEVTTPIVAGHPPT